MRDAIDQLLTDLRAEIIEERFDDGSEARLKQRMALLPVLSDDDLRVQLEVPVRAIAVMRQAMTELLGPAAAQEAGFDALHADAQALVDDAFAHDETPFRQSRRVVGALAAALSEGRDPVAAASEARAALDAIDGLAVHWRSQADFAVGSLLMWAGWNVMRRKAELSGEHADSVATWNEFERSLGDEGSTLAWIESAAALVRVNWPENGAGPGEHRDTAAAESAALLAQSAAGIVLVRRPDMLPGLEPLRQLSVSAEQAAQRLSQVAVAAVPEPTLADRCGAVLADFDARVASEGFSQYVIEQSVAALREIPVNADSREHEILTDAMVALVDRALPIAPPDAQGALAALRQTVQQMRGQRLPPLDEAGIVAGGDAILERFDREIALGEEPGGAYARAIGALQALALRVPDEDQESQAGERLGDCMMAWMQRLMQRLPQVVPETSRAKAEGLSADMVDATASFGRLLHLQGDAQEIEAQAAMSRLQGLHTLQSTAESDESHLGDPVLQQVMASLRAWGPRILTLAERNDAAREGTFDARELKRLKARSEVALTRARSITHEPQLIEQLRLSLRPLALEMRAFEQRRHLMTIEPPFGLQPVVPEPDAVFVSGGAAVQALVAEAAQRLGMTEPQRTLASDSAETRWLQLRAAAVAVFDFTAYDRGASDPATVPPRSSAAEAEVLEAAGPVARVAFEAGWAWLLGVPMVVIARAGQLLPFDIDLEAVRISDDGFDAHRIGAGLVRAIFGAARGGAAAADDGLAHTLAALRQRVAGVPAAARVLAGVSDTADALAVRHAVEVVLRAAKVKALLVTPGMAPPPWSSADGERTSPQVFHVTAFRTWSEPVSALLRQECERKGLVYRIGHEDLDPQILRAVWHGLVQADRVIVDLTVLNPNAVLELAVAQALGRPLLVISRHGDLGRHLPHLRTLRMHAYDTSKSGREVLARLVRQFLQDGSRGGSPFLEGRPKAS